MKKEGELKRRERIHRIAFESGERTRKISDELRLVSLAIECESFNHCTRDGEIAAIRLIEIDAEIHELGDAIKELVRLGLGRGGAV